MTDQDITKGIWQQYVEDFRPNLEKLFASSGWKKALLPFLKAHRERQVRIALNPGDTDFAKGFCVALEMIMNLPQGMSSAKAEPAIQQESTHYSDSVAFDDE